ncbi:ABC transporter ATP-binding protein [Micromonospora carbonacea]|uniref:Amino acid/amide ABC transporter ATP-binding protein 1, HAAT family n=1 Tax=Micromonospora carbonacea TaxID=47853 RepID=A0A1C4V527_9ACTN|nr:ATP-binding cassette domain-containing protein [Micromonospora carbonacea]SCE79113.1 amino acid/amide ABC transporter ATP-binding protein 1, HAAT family [Micromonospora carbonacea]
MSTGQSVDAVDCVPSRRTHADIDRAHGTGLTATGLRHCYGKLTVLDLDAFAIAPGDRHAVIGPNGAGKSTLLNLLAGTIGPTTGQITLHAQTITRRRSSWRARAGIGRTFQHPTVYPGLTVLDCVRIGGWHHRHNPHHTPHELLNLVGLAGYADEAAGHLTHGHRRMLDLAVALAGQPRILLLDEPAAGLTDTETTQLLDILTSLPGWLAMVIVEHDMTVVTALADWTTVLHHGRRITDGPTAEVRADPTVAALYLGTPETTDAAHQ